MLFNDHFPAVLFSSLHIRVVGFIPVVDWNLLWRYTAAGVVGVLRWTSFVLSGLQTEIEPRTYEIRGKLYDCCMTTFVTIKSGYCIHTTAVSTVLWRAVYRRLTLWHAIYVWMSRDALSQARCQRVLAVTSRLVISWVSYHGSNVKWAFVVSVNDMNYKTQQEVKVEVM